MPHLLSVAGIGQFFKRLGNGIAGDSGLRPGHIHYNTTEAASSVQDLTIASGFNGDQKEIWAFDFRIINPTGSDANYHLSINGLYGQATMRTQLLFVLGASVSAVMTANALILASAKANKQVEGWAMMETHSHPNVSLKHLFSHTTMEYAAPDYVAIADRGGIYNNNTLIITSFGIHASVAGAIGTGSKFSTYYRNWYAVP